MWLPVLCGALVVACPARAEGPAAAAQAPKARSLDEAAETAAARAAHLRGLAAREKGDWPEAYSAFLEAWTHKHHWEIAVNLGEAEMRQAKYEDARSHLLFARAEPGFLERSPELVTEETRQIDAWVADADAKIAAARERAARERAARERAAREAPPRRPWPWIVGVGGGLFATAVVSGGVMTAMANGKVAEVDASLQALPGKTGDPASVRCDGAAAAATCGANQERLRSADSMQSAATGLFVTAGVVAAATAVLAVAWPERREGAPVVAPVIEKTGAGVAVSASW